jgi:hypothetical protein
LLLRIILELVRFRNLPEDSSHSDSIDQSRLHAHNGPLKHESERRSSANSRHSSLRNNCSFSFCNQIGFTGRVDYFRLIFEDQFLHRTRSSSVKLSGSRLLPPGTLFRRFSRTTSGFSFLRVVSNMTQQYHYWVTIVTLSSSYLIAPYSLRFYTFLDYQPASRGRR